MARNQVRLDSAGVEDILKSAETHRAIRVVTEGLAARVRGMESEYPVESEVITTDRAHGLVSIAHPAGLAIQAKRGTLTKAASQAGLDVSDRA